ncbi:MAG TPA: glycosyltransferase family 4 protein [Streptosporangiaceae bacterium]|nr:glycosyltransferase family 4 protein [Streptosporangiaceae bacterium]
MRVLVYPQAAERGEPQLDAVEIAAATRDRGHEVLVATRPGPLAATARRFGLPHAQLDTRAGLRPSRQAASQLTRLARQHRIDVVHGYEWPSALESFAGPRLRLGLPVVCTVNSAHLAPFLPRTVPLVVGTDETRLRAMRAGHGPVTLLEAPLDLRANVPDYDPGAFRASLGLDEAVPLVVTVGRLASEVKLEGLRAACDAVAELASWGTPVQLAVVGDGPSRRQVERAAAAANARAGRRAIVMAGPLPDPRPAYAAADVIVGMGEAALRGLAFGKPLVVQGDCGFWELLTPDSAPQLIRQGWYGLGTEGRRTGTIRLMSILRELVGQPDTRTRLGRFGRALVMDRYSLERTAAAQEDVYAEAMELSARPSALALAADTARTGAGLLRHTAVRAWHRWRGAAPPDEFRAPA